MALLFMDSFDHYTGLTDKWTTYVATYSGTEMGGIIAGAGRRGGGALRLAANASSTCICGSLGLTANPVGNKIVVGFAFVLVAPGFAYLNGSNFGADQGSFSTPCCILSIRNLGWTQIWLKLNTDGTVSVYRSNGQGSSGSTLLGTTSATLVQAVYTYIEVAATIDATVGAVSIRFNGVQAMTPLINQNTVANQNTVGWNAIRLGPQECGVSNTTAGLETRYDDLYVLDGSGAAPWNTFLGDCRVEAMMPSGVGANSGWAPSAGANWQCVDDATPNADTDFTAATTAGATDTFATPDLLVAGTTVLGVQHCLSAKKADAGIATIAPVIRSGGVDYPGADLAPNTGYSVLRQVAQVNPGTAAQWTMADFNAAEFGYRRTT